MPSVIQLIQKCDEDEWQRFCFRWFDSQEEDGCIVRELKGSTMLDSMFYNKANKALSKELIYMYI